MRLLLAFALAPTLLGQDLVGPLKYVRAGVQLAGRTTPWRSVASIEERDPDLAAEYAARKATATANAQFELGRWCREHSLPAADTHLARALELDGKHEGALCALGRAPDLVAAQRRTLQPLAFADWCRDRALPDLQWTAIVTVLVQNPLEREAIRRMKDVMDQRCATTLLRPPFTGRWQAIVDATRHHQQFCHAVYAIDFAMVDDNDRPCRGKGKALGDWYSWEQPVLAAADGEVTVAKDHFADNPAGTKGKFEEANLIEIKHADGQMTCYAHLKQGSITVKVGQQVKAGDELGRIGNSGMSAGPHLHFALNLSAYAGGQGVYVGQPYRIGGFRLVKVAAVPCSVEVRSARPQEGWVLDCPPPRAK